MLSSASQKTYALFQNPANREIIAFLEKNESRYFSFPALEIHKTASENDRKFLEEKLNDFDWLVFTDVFAVDAFLELLEEGEVDFFLLDELKVLAFGEAVSDRLRFVRLHTDVIPASMTGEAIFEALTNYEADVDSLKFLFVKECETRFSFIDKLKNAGAEVEEFPVFRAQIKNNDEIARLKALIKGGAIDEIIFAAPEDFFAFSFYFSPDEISDIVSETTVSATNDVTFQTIRENNLAPRFFRTK